MLDAEATEAERREADAARADREFRKRVGAALRDKFYRLSPLTLAVHARQFLVVELLIE